jgi:hypothetical protein
MQIMIYYLSHCRNTCPTKYQILLYYLSHLCNHCARTSPLPRMNKKNSHFVTLHVHKIIRSNHGHLLEKAGRLMQPPRVIWLAYLVVRMQMETVMRGSRPNWMGTTDSDAETKLLVR